MAMPNHIGPRQFVPYSTTPQYSVEELKQQIIDNANFLHGDGSFRVITLERESTYQAMLLDSSLKAPKTPYSKEEWDKYVLEYGDWFIGRYEALEGLLISMERKIRMRVVGERRSAQAIAIVKPFPELI